MADHPEPGEPEHLDSAPKKKASTRMKFSGRGPVCCRRALRATLGCCLYGRQPEMTFKLYPPTLKVLCRTLDAESGFLEKDIEIHGELIKKGTRLLRVAGKTLQGDALIGTITESAIAGKPLRITFSGQTMSCLASLVLRSPCLLIVLTLACLGALMGVGISGVSLNSDMSSFLESDGTNSMRYNIMIQAISDHSSSSSRRLAVQLYRYFYFNLIYVKEGSSVLSYDEAVAIQAFEQELKKLPEYQAICSIVEGAKERFCEEGLSIFNSIFPTPSSATDTQYALRPDGGGTVPVPLSIAMQLAEADETIEAVLPTDLQDATLELPSYLPCKDHAAECATWRAEGQCLTSAEHVIFMRDFCALTCGFCNREADLTPTSDTDTEAISLEVARSVFGFKAWCCNSDHTDQSRRLNLLKDNWKTLVAAVVDYCEKAKDREDFPVQVYYEGSSFEGYQASVALMQDLYWAICAYVFVVIYATLYTRSLILAFGGLFFVMLSIPSALSIFFLISGSDEVSIILGIAVFIVIGVGSDMMFVYTDFWKSSLEYSRDPTHRLRYLHSQASLSTAATTFTTATSFLANLASVLRPLREFGFVMGITMVLAWLIVFLTFPPLLVISEKFHRDMKAALLRYSAGKEAAVAAAASSSDIKVLDSEKPKLKRQTTNAQALTMRSTRKVALLIDPEKHGIGELQSQLLAGRLTGFIQKMRLIVIVLCMVFTGWAFFISIQNVEQDAGVPQLFLSDHNAVAIEPYSAMFDDVDTMTMKTYVTSGTSCSDLFSSCEFYECTTFTERLGTASSCDCVAENGTSDLCLAYQVDLSFVGHASYLETAVSTSQIEDMVHSRAATSAGVVTMGSGSQSDPAVLVATTWETGEEEVLATAQLPSFSVAFERDQLSLCSEADFEDLSGTLVEETWISATSESSFNLLCCTLCSENSDCEFWVREVEENATQLRCWLMKEPYEHSSPGDRLGGWAHRATNLLGDTEIAIFSELLGTEVATSTAVGSDGETLDAACCKACSDRADCQYWVRDTVEFDGSSQSITCSLRKDPKLYIATSSARGGWKCADVQLPPSQFTCVEEWTCYCDAKVCTDTEEVSVTVPRGTLKLESPTRRLQTTSTATVTQVPPASRIDVIIAFGLTTKGSTKLLGESSELDWEYLSSFKLEDPWAQRRSLDLCENFDSKLLVAKASCWLIGFKEYRISHGEEWPVRTTEDFHAEAYYYANNQETDGYQTTEFVWFDASNRVVAMYAQIYLDATLWYSTSKSMTLLEYWDERFENWNSEAETHVKGAWHCSRLWVRAEAEKLIVDSLALTMIISLSCVFLGVALFTRSILLACIVMALVACIVADLLFFMVMIAGWALGAIEVLSLIIFVGFAVDYCLHVAHEYHACQISLGAEAEEDIAREPQRESRFSVALSTDGREQLIMKASTFRKSVDQSAAERAIRKQNPAVERFERSRFALSSMGSAVFGSAVTTVGCSIFLVPCVLYVFRKIGLVVIAVTCFAVIHALLPLPAVLMTLGPCNHDFRSVLEVVRNLADRCLSDLMEDPEIELSGHSPVAAHLHSHAGNSSKSEEAGGKAGTYYYVLHMPAAAAQGVASLGARENAFRTRVRVNG